MATQDEEAWLQSMCVPADNAFGEKLKRPFGAYVHGRTWSVGCNGKALLALERSVPLTTPPPMEMLETLIKVDGPGVPVEIAALKDFAGEPWRPPEIPACDRCETSGWLECSECRGSGEHVCRDCDAEHDCGVCDGDGEVACPDCKTAKLGKEPIRLGRIGRATLDLNLLARGLAGLEPQTAQVRVTSDPLDPVEIRGKGWSLVVMPYRPADDRTELPTFEIKEAA